MKMKTARTFATLRRCRMISASAVTWAVVGLLVHAMSATVAAQEENPGLFGEVLDVRVINLEVVVTDKQGVRVLGFAPEDFVLTVDGTEVPVEYFTEVIGGSSITPGEAESTVPALAPGVPVSTSYLIFVDEYFSFRRDRDRALRQLRDQLPLLNPEDRMAVVAYDGRNVDMLSTWSQSREALGRVLDSAADRPTFGQRRRAELRSFRTSRTFRAGEPRDFTDSVASLGLDLDLEEQAEAERIADQVSRTILAASAALRGFANPPGRKVMILLSGGWPYNPVYWVINDISRSAFTTDVPDGDELYRPLIETANRIGYTLYTADMPGLGPSLIDGEGIAANAEPANASLRFSREQEAEFSLTQLARETGGKAFLNSASNSVFERVVEDTRSYYWLGFTPTWAGDDAEHTIRVRTTRRGFKVRTRENFTDLSKQTEVTMMVESTLLFGNTPGSENLPVTFGAAQKAGRGKVEVPFRLGIPLHVLTFLPSADGFRSEVELRIAVIDEQGNTADIPILGLPLRLDELPTGELFTVFENRIKIRKKPHDIVFSIYEQATGKILSNRLEFKP